MDWSHASLAWRSFDRQHHGRNTEETGRFPRLQKKPKTPEGKSKRWCTFDITLFKFYVFISTFNYIFAKVANEVVFISTQLLFFEFGSNLGKVFLFSEKKNILCKFCLNWWMIKSVALHCYRHSLSWIMYYRLSIILILPVFLVRLTLRSSIFVV